MTGVLWAAISGVGFGVFQAFNRKAGKGIDVFRGTFILLFISAVVLVLASLLTEDLNLLASARPSAFLFFALAGSIHFFVGWTLLSISQTRVGAARTGAIVGSTPLFATMIAALTLGEYLDWVTVLGIVCLVVGVYLVSNG